ncbi:hypothetical protein PTKIN_Ptkin18bG0135200 [Pterospermum kingtungense]
MSKAGEASSSLRRLVGLFATKRSSTTKPTVVTSSKCTPEARELQKLAKRFKQSSESNRFRSCSKQVYTDTVRRLASAKQFSLIDDILQHQKKYKDISGEGFVVRLIKLYGKAGMFEHAQKLFDEMPELKCPRTVKSFNALLTASVYSKKFDIIEKLCEELPEKLGIEPDLISYNTIVKAFSKMGSLDSTLSVIDILEKKGLEPNIITFNTMLAGFYSEGRIAEGDKIWELMETKNIVPNVQSYNAKLRGLAYKNNMLEAVELWGKMESNGIKPDIRSHNILVKGYCNDGNLEQVKKWYIKLKKSNCLPDRVTYLTLVPFLCKKDEFEMAIELCKEAIDRRVVAETALMNGLIEESMVDEAIQLMELGHSRFGLKMELPSNLK